MAKKKVRVTQWAINEMKRRGKDRLYASGNIDVPKVNLMGNDVQETSRATASKPPKTVTIKGASQLDLRRTYDALGNLGGVLEEYVDKPAPATETIVENKETDGD